MYVGARERRDGQSRLLRPGRTDDEPLLLQPLECFANGSAAHAESRRDFGLHDAAARSEQPLHDEIAQTLVDLFRPRAVRCVGSGQILRRSHTASERR